MEFFRIRRDIPFMRYALVFNVISLVTFALAVVFLACFFPMLRARRAEVSGVPEGIRPVIAVLPLIALPIAFLMILALLIMTFVRRARANRGG